MRAPLAAALVLLASAMPTAAEAAATFQSTPVTSAHEGKPYLYEVVASGLGEVRVTAPEGLPNWLTLTRVGNGQYRLAGTAPGGRTQESVVLETQDSDPSWLCRVFPAFCRERQTFTISIIENNPPVLVSPGIPDQEAVQGVMFELDVSAYFEDPDGDPLSFAASGLPPSLQLDTRGTLSGRPAASDVASSPFTVTITADDGRGGEARDTFRLIVQRQLRADLVLEPIAVSPVAALREEPIEWLLTVRNAGPDASGPIVLEVEFAGTPFTATEHPCALAGATEPGERLECALDPLPVGDSASVRLVGSAAAAGDVFLSAVARSLDGRPMDPNPDNSSAWGSAAVAETLALEAAQRLPEPAAAAAAGDLDGDGFDDLVLATGADAPVLVHLNIETPGSLHSSLMGPDDLRRGLSSLPLSAGEASPHADVLLVDIDLDGRLDVVVGGAGGQPGALLLNEGHASLSVAQALGEGGGRALAAGDLTGDGYPDVVLAGGGSTVIYRNAGGELVRGASLGGARDTAAVLVADLTANGFGDIVTVTAGGPAYLHRNRGDGSFADPVQIDPGPATSVAAGDFDGDGLVDLVFGRPSPGPSGLPSNPVYLNEGGTFRLAAELGAAATLQVLAADVTGNGALDIITIGAGGAHQVHAGDGRGGFTLHGRQFVSPGVERGAIGRFGRDQSLGLALVGPDGTAVFFNDGAGNLGLGMIERPVIELIGPSEISLPVGDSYEEPGARASDAAGEALVPEVDNPVNTAVVGTYSVTYTAMDRAGNAAEPVSRTVRVEARQQTSGGGGGAGGGALIGLLLAAAAMRGLRRRGGLIRLIGRSA